MRRYAKISPQFWIGDTGRKLRESGHETLLVALYLLSNPHANMLGLYYLPTSLIAHETGLTQEEALKGLRRAIEAGFCGYDDRSEMVFVHEMARYQIADHLAPADKQCAGIQREYEALANNAFLGMFYDKYVEAFHLTKRRDQRRPLEGASEAHRSQEQEQEQEKASSSEQKTSSDKESVPPPKRLTTSPSHEASRLAALLKEEIQKNKTDYQIPPDQERSWAITADRMLRRDERSAERIAAVIRWAQHDEFEMSNVLSMDKVRKRFDQLEMKARINCAKKSVTVALPSTYVPASEKIRQERATAAGGVQ
jgi:hypothetical protein